MLEMCTDYIWLFPCACDDKTTGLGSLKAGQVFTTKGSDVIRIPPNEMKDHDVWSSECAYCFFPNAGEGTTGDDATWVFHVTRNPAARWLQMDAMLRNTFSWKNTEPRLFIRDNETCMLCACKFFSEYWQSTFESPCSPVRVLCNGKVSDRQTSYSVDGTYIELTLQRID